MRLVSFSSRDSGRRVGALLSEDRIVDLQRAAAAYLKRERRDALAAQEAVLRVPSDIVRLIDGGEHSLTLIRKAAAWVASQINTRPDLQGIAGESLVYPREAVVLHAPFLPRLIVCGGANFRDHLEELGRERPEHVEFFLKSPYSVVGPEDAIAYQPWVTTRLDYEVEIAVVIGRAGRNIPRDRALGHVAGYMVGNDLAARDRQIISWAGPLFHLKYGEGKSFDSACVLGPALVTPDDLPDISNLAMRTWVNGNLRQSSTTANFLWDVPGVIEYYSTFMTLLPGFVILPGTPGGCAVGNDPELGGRPGVRAARGSDGYLQPGDVVRCEVEGLGALENRVVAVDEQYEGGRRWLDSTT
jgi:2-keto-4-pentenoate hydratase/2-oxohepta-3-ene-1,7-dioic acid hydratase in catechol pathway